MTIGTLHGINRMDTYINFIKKFNQVPCEWIYFFIIIQLQISSWAVGTYAKTCMKY